MNTERARIVIEMIGRHLENTDVLVSTNRLLHDIIDVLTRPEEVEDKPQPIAETVPVVTREAPNVIISCDASIKVNPGGPASVGVVIEAPGKQNLEFARPCKAITNNQAEYDAVYLGLTTFINLSNNPGCPICVRSDSQIVIKQLNGTISCQDKTLARRRDLIRELACQLPVSVIFEWRPRNSTKELERANHLAQDLLGVSRH